MPAYFIADIDITDPETYQGYFSEFMELFERYNGKMRAVSSSPIEVMEGDWVPPGIVVMEFPSMARAMSRKDDPDNVAPSKSAMRLYVPT